MKFLVGRTYTRPGLYGPNFPIKCMNIIGTMAFFAQVGYEDEEHTPIKIEEENGVERCLCWESQGQKCYIYSDEPR